MNQALMELIKAIESGELVITSFNMERPEERKSWPPWVPEESNWCFKVVRVPEKYREPIDLTKEYLANIPSGPGRDTDLTK